MSNSIDHNNNRPERMSKGRESLVWLGLIAVPASVFLFMAGPFAAIFYLVTFVCVVTFSSATKRRNSN